MRVRLDIVDANWLKVVFDREECKYDMVRYYTHKLDDVYLANNYKHRFSKWDGKVRFYNKNTEQIYLGLLSSVLQYLTSRGYNVEFSDSLKKHFKEIISNEDKEFNLDNYRPKEFGLRQYQRNAVLECLMNKRRLIQSPTASGKSFIIHNVVSYLRDQGKDCLIIVPSITLVNQMGGDFTEYGMSRDDYHLICEGAEKHTDAPIVISTWQSLQYLLDQPEYFERFECVIVDEAHQADSEVIVKLIKSCINAEYRFGFSGTYFKPKTDIMTLVGLFGPKFVAATTRQLIDWGYLPQLEIGIVILKYLNEDRRITKNCKYPAEMNFIETHRARNEFVANLALTRKGNTLCLFRKIEHGKYLKKLTDELNDGSKKIFFLTGQNKDKDRQLVKRIMEENHDCVVYASYGIFSVGVSIKNLHNTILGSDMKSHNRIAQSIGRTLRKLAGKEIVNIYDIFDDLSVTMTKNGKRKLTVPWENYAYRHGFDRIELYENEEFDCQVMSRELKMTYKEGIELEENNDT